MPQPPIKEVKPLWVRLYLERQSDSSFMPPFVVGLLSNETATSYVLTKIMEYKENSDTFEMEAHILTQHNHINKTYVWRCEVIGEKPPIDEEPFNGEEAGGLG